MGIYESRVYFTSIYIHSKKAMNLKYIYLYIFDKEVKFVMTNVFPNSKRSKQSPPKPAQSFIPNSCIYFWIVNKFIRDQIIICNLLIIKII